MDRNLDALLQFAPDHDAPIRYMQRTRDYYAAIGYTTPYRWAHYVEAPFAALRKPLANSRITIVTTAAPYRPEKGDQGPGAPYNGGAKFYQVYSGDTSQTHDLRISHIGYDRVHTSAEDSGTWFPLPALLRAVAAGRVGTVAPQFHGAPTNRSHRVTVETDAPEILRRCQKEDGADAVILVPNCPVCHQTCSLSACRRPPAAVGENSSSTTSRALRGSETPVIGSAPDPPGRTQSCRRDARRATGRARCGGRPGR